MASFQQKPLINAQDYELHAPRGHTEFDSEDYGFPNRHERPRSLSGPDDFTHLKGTSSTVFPNHELPLRSLGEPTTKKSFHVLHLLAAGLSLLCLALAIAGVANEDLSWRLGGKKNDQLIVLGFLLSIMNLCVGTVAPSLFLKLEARFGSSTLQNYDGIARNRVLSPKLSLSWRLILGGMLALPLGLSVAYKTFTGGQSAMKVDPKPYVGNASYYGMFAPPGLQTLGAMTGISLFSNATLPFLVASSSQTGSEPPLPQFPQAYGFNVLALNNGSSAILDIPEPSYISAVQDLLAGGESWNISAPVFATVATSNFSRKSEFIETCEDAEASSGAFTHMSAIDNFSITLVDRPSPGDQSLQYIALSPDPGLEHSSSCSNLSHYAQPYEIYRQLCQGTWSITRGGIQLVEGSCDGTILPPNQQQPFTNNTKGLFLGVWYMSSLVEALGPFGVLRNQSQWVGPSIATSMAAMLWSRVTIANGAAIPDDVPALQRMYRNLTYEEVGLVYPVDDIVVYVRPTLRKSGLLYWVFAIQPLLTVIGIALIWMLRSTPVDNDFCLISILSGIDRKNLDVLAGAALSGRLARKIRLVMQPLQDDGKGTIEYRCQLLPSTERHMCNGRLRPDTVYH